MLPTGLRDTKKKQTKLKGFLGLYLPENRAEGQLADGYNLSAGEAPYVRVRAPRTRFALYGKTGPAENWITAGDVLCGSERGQFQLEQTDAGFLWQVHTDTARSAGGSISLSGEGLSTFFKQYARVTGMAGQALVFPSVPDKDLEMGPTKSVLYSAPVADGHGEDAPTPTATTLDNVVLYGGCAFDNNLYCFGRQWDKQGVSVPMMFVSALGQPTVFTPDGTDAGAFYFPVVTDSDFTAICAYKGSVYFFTGHEMYQIYGTVPSNYTAQKIHNVGCIGPDGLCELDGVLYFTDGTSLYAFSGGTPGAVSGALGNLGAQDACLCPGEEMLYLLCRQAQGDRLYTYRPKNSLYYREQTDGMLRLFSYRGRPAAAAGGVLVSLCGGMDAPALQALAGEGAVPFRLETGDLLLYESPFVLRHVLRRVLLRLSVTGTAHLSVHAALDGGPWRTLYSAPILRSGTVELPLRLPPCSRLRLAVSGAGDVLFMDLAKEAEQIG